MACDIEKLIEKMEDRITKYITNFALACYIEAKSSYFLIEDHYVIYMFSTLPCTEKCAKMKTVIT